MTPNAWRRPDRFGRTSWSPSEGLLWWSNNQAGQAATAIIQKTEIHRRYDLPRRLTLSRCTTLLLMAVIRNRPLYPAPKLRRGEARRGTRKHRNNDGGVALDRSFWSGTWDTREKRRTSGLISVINSRQSAIRLLRHITKHECNSHRMVDIQNTSQRRTEIRP